MISDHPQTILVDEPQSFLHPGAVRKLIEVLKRYPQHQYIFATHSPTVITSSEPATVTMVHSTPDGASLRNTDPNDAKDAQGYLSEIGARLSDVFGADNILWVEGQTEEVCFPKILRRISGRSLMGTAIVGIRQTGNLLGREKKKVLEIYQRLSQANTLLPPVVAFIFDEECLSDLQKNDLVRIGQGDVHFLPRRMYENYLLRPAAIATVANNLPGFRTEPLREDEVDHLINQKRQNLGYFCSGIAQVPEAWIAKIDGARVLSDIFGQLSENRVAYDKTKHSVAITDWLIQNDPNALRDLANMLDHLLATQEVT